MKKSTFFNKIDNIRKAAVNKVENIRLNKAGTIGTEKIAYPMGNGGFENKVDVKVGPLGKFSIPTGTMTYKKPANAGLAGSDYHLKAQAFIKSAKAKGYTVKAEGDQLIAYPPKKFKPMNSKPSNGIGVGGN